MAKEHFKYEDMTLVLVGDKKLLQKQIKSYRAIGLAVLADASTSSCWLWSETSSETSTCARPGVLVGVADGLREHGLGERLELPRDLHLVAARAQGEVQVASAPCAAARPPVAASCSSRALDGRAGAAAAL